MLPSRISNPNSTRTIFWKNCSLPSPRSKSLYNLRWLVAPTYNPRRSHKDVREMEHELFQSKLKLLVDDAVFSEIVENSSSGEQPYRAEAMELVLERSIQECRKRTIATKSPQLDPTTLQESPQLPPDPNVAPTPKMAGVSPKSSTLSKPPKKSKTKHEEPPAIPKTNLSSERTVELVCSRCGLRCYPSCPIFWRCSCSGMTAMKCAGCKTARVGLADACTNCHGKFRV